MTLEELTIRRRHKLNKAILAADPLHAELEERELREQHARNKRLLAKEQGRLSLSHLAYEWTGLCSDRCF
jgi:hypothetical protein